MRALITCLMLSCAAFAGAPPSEPYTCDVIVPEAGWYRVPVDGHIWRYARGRVLAFDASGKMLPCGILPVEVPSPASEEAQPKLVGMEEEGDRLVLYLEVDRLAGKHDRLILDFGGADLLEQATLWGSSDGREWKAMAQGTLFRLGGGERMQGTALDYPASGFDHLKLVLPLGGEMKRTVREFRVGNIRLHYAPEETISAWVDEPVDLRPADRDLENALVGTEGTLWLMDLPEGSLSAQRVSLSLGRPHLPMALSLLSASRGQIVCGYSCVLEPEALSFPVPGGRLQSPVLLKVDDKKNPLAPLSVRRLREEVLFFTDRPGRIALAYGGFEQRPTDFPPIRRISGIREAECGPVATHPISLSHELARFAVGSPPKGDIHLRWALNLPEGVKPGHWATIELTPEMKAQARESAKGNWAVASGGRLIPSFGKADPVPLLGKAERIALTADPVFPGQSQGEMVWGREVFPVIWLSLKARGLGEPVSVLVEGFRDPNELQGIIGDPPSSSYFTIGRTTIECGPWTSDCMAMMGYSGPTPEKVMITVEGRTLPPPRSIEVSVWRLGHRLVFPVPEGSDVALIYGTAPQESGVTLRPYIAVDRIPGNLPNVKVGALVDQGAKKRSWDRALFLGALILAVAALLYLIVKLLPRRQEG